MDPDSSTRRCSSCQSGNLADGRTGIHRHTFLSGAGFFWVGFPTSAFACLDCGFVGHYLNARELRKLQEKINR